ncbi:MAG: hydroxymethylglutaryl-CoA synthase [Thaumarchaeota archaeon]|nr:hydroxymethylglutaryl-CoA synthase [Nitrososphaerota archaeon]
MADIGVEGYGVHIPEARIRSGEYVKAWGSFAASGVVEKTVPDFDEDTVGMGVAAAKHALLHSGIEPKRVSALSFASTTPPYIEKMSTTSIMTPLGFSQEVFATEHITSTRAGTEAFLSALSYLKGVGSMSNGLVVASDAPRAAMTDIIEHGYGAAAVAMVLGSKKVLAKIEGFSSCAYERMGERFKPPRENLTKDLGITAYNEQSFKAVVSSSVKTLLKKLKVSPKDFSYVVIQQPDGRLHRRVAAELGFRDEQLELGSLVTVTGDTGCASVLLGLAAVLDAAGPRQRILVASYGSGAGSDAISLVTTNAVKDAKRKTNTVKKELEDKRNIDYLTYLKMRQAIR